MRQIRRREVGSPSPWACSSATDQYQEKPRLQWPFYTYFSDLPVDDFEIYIREFRGFAAAATNDGLTMVVVGWPYTEARTYKADVEGSYCRTLELAPQFAARARAATREPPFLGGAVPNYLRVPFGPGWALVGDADYNQDPITAQGITDAFHDAENELLGAIYGNQDAMDDFVSVNAGTPSPEVFLAHQPDLRGRGGAGLAAG